MTVVRHPAEGVFAAAFRGAPCVFTGPGMHRLEVPAHSWTRSIDGDSSLLDLCEGPTLDFGCGPGRLTHRLAERGEIVLGIDVVP